MQLGEIKRRAGDGAQRESILELEDWSRASGALIELYVLQERRIEFEQALRSDAVVVLVEDPIAATDDHFLRELVGDSDARSEIIFVWLDQCPVGPTRCVARGADDTSTIRRSEVGDQVVAAHDGSKQFIAHAIGQVHLGSRSPRVHGIERVSGLEVVDDERRGEACRVYVA